MPTSSEAMNQAHPNGASIPGIAEQLPAISVVIPTFNRASILVDTVTELLAAPSASLLEVLVVDQSDAPNHWMERKGDSRLRYFRVPFKGLTKARNFAIERVRGDIVLFLDDDVTNLAGTVDGHARAHARYQVEIVTGPTLARGNSLLSVDDLTPEQRRKLALGEMLHPAVDFMYTPVFAPGCNSSYRRSVFATCGGFDENFFGNAIGEDAEMCWRVRTHFGRLLYHPDAAIVHLAAPTGGCRDADYEARRLRTSILNGHYFLNKVGIAREGRPFVWQALRQHVLTPDMFTPAGFVTALRKAPAVVMACFEARRRTARLLCQRQIGTN